MDQVLRKALVLEDPEIVPAPLRPDLPRTPVPPEASTFQTPASPDSDIVTH